MKPGLSRTRYIVTGLCGVFLLVGIVGLFVSVAFCFKGFVMTLERGQTSLTYYNNKFPYRSYYADYSGWVLQTTDPVPLSRWPALFLPIGPQMFAWSVVLPIWVPLLLTGMASALLWRAHFRKADALLCPDCGYDLRATPYRCPECGWIVSQQKRFGMMA
jgi:hypothetical protein